MEEKLELEFNKIVEELTPIIDNLKNERSNTRGTKKFKRNY